MTAAGFIFLICSWGDVTLKFRFSFLLRLVATTSTAVAHGVQADRDNTDNDLKENENDDNPLKLFAVRGRQVLLQHIQQITDNGRPLVQQLNTLSNLQITCKRQNMFLDSDSLRTMMTHDGFRGIDIRLTSDGRV